MINEKKSMEVSLSPVFSSLPYAQQDYIVRLTIAANRHPVKVLYTAEQVAEMYVNKDKAGLKNLLNIAYGGGNEYGSVKCGKRYF